MATVRIGEKDLDVKVATLGFLKHKLRPARKAMQEASEDQMEDSIVNLILCYVGHNEGVSAEWLLESLPADPTAVIRACIEASGQQVAPRGDSKGEAARP